MKKDKARASNMSIFDKKEYEHDKIKGALPQLRFIFLCFALLYGAFGYLDYLIIDEHIKQFTLIRFVIVIPLLLFFVVISYNRVIFQIGHYIITICLMAGGVGIAYMLIIYPDNFSYYGGLFMVIFSGYFLLSLNTYYAIFGNAVILFFYIFGYTLIYKTLSIETFMVITFFVGANIIGAVGNFQLESMGRARYMQDLEIKSKNILLEDRVITQHKELLQIEKAFDSTSDAMAIFSPSGQLVNYNSAFTKLMETKDTSDMELFNQLDSIIFSVIEGELWNEEITIETNDKGKQILLVQADSVYEDKKIIGAVATLKDITERKAIEDHIKYIGTHDNLTGLYNRYWYDKELLNLDSKEQLPLSIIMADLNGLKLLNDTYGHEVGDKFLKSAAELFKDISRKEDLVARWGGDEFVILLPRTSYEGAKVIADRIALESYQVQYDGIPISMALGVACKESEEEEISEIIRLAEDKMYRQKLTDSRSAKSAILNALNKTMMVKSFETEAHADNMQNVGQKLGKRLGLSSDELSRLDLVTKLHDIGKINIPEEILGKNGALTPDEWVIMKKHTEIGYRIAQATEEFAHVAKEILGHHEKWDGSGYPQNLKGEDIPYLSRIVNVVDSYEVMLNGRPYKKPMSKEEIIKELKRCSGKQFDPNIVEVFLKVIDEKQ